MNTVIATQDAAGTRVNSLTDEQLLTQYRETGDRDLFAQLVSRYERELYSYLHRYTGNAEMAEDAFQGTFLQVHLKCDQFQPGRTVRPWLYAIATNQAIDAQRRNRRHRIASLDQNHGSHDSESGSLMDMLVSDEPDPHEQVDAREHEQWVRDAIAELPEHLRAVIAMVYFQGLKYREAAEALSIPVGTVKSRMHAAVSKLNEAWQASQAERN